MMATLLKVAVPSVLALWEVTNKPAVALVATVRVAEPILVQVDPSAES